MWIVKSLGLILIFWLLTGGALAGGSTTVDSIVDSLQKNYDATADFTAEFRQETEVKALNRHLKAWGTLYFKRPGKMLWRYEEPKDQFVVTDEKHLYFFQPEQNQIIKTPLKAAFRSDIPLSFLLGIGSLKKDFNVSLKATEEDHYVLQLQPKTDPGGFSEVLLGVEKKTFDIVWASVRDASNNLTTLRFSRMRKGVGLKDSLFQVQIPDGVDLVELGQ